MIEKERDLKDQLDKMIEQDAKVKAEQEEKRLEHEEELFVADL